MEIKPNLFFPSFSKIASAKNYKTILDVQDEKPKTNPVDERRKKRMADIKEAFAKLSELKESNSPKKLASQRAGILKQRLEALKAILEKLPPGNYKALAQELKQIAQQLNVVSKSAGSSAGGASSMPVMSFNTDEASADSNSEEGVDAESTVNAASDTTEADTSASDAKEAEKLAKEVENEVGFEAPTKVNSETNDKADEQDELNSTNLPIVGVRSNDDIDDKALREILTEAGKLVRQVLSLLKAKHQDDDEETRELFKDIEKELGDLDKSLEQGNLASQEQALGVSLDMAGVGGIGSVINTSA